MTKAEILSAVRYLVNEKSTTAGAHLDDAGNLLEFVQSAVEDVVMDLMKFMPGQLAVAENISLIANQANYTLTTSFGKSTRSRRTSPARPRRRSRSSTRSSRSSR